MEIYYNRVMKQPLVTVITPLYNYEKYIGECIESILKQTYPNIEHIIVDDESTDGSAEIVKSYAQKHAQIHYIYQSGKKLGPWKIGIVPALNTGINAAKGEYIVWLSADDRAYPERIAKSIEAFQNAEDEKLAMVYGKVHFEAHERACFDKIPLAMAEIETQFSQQGYVHWLSQSDRDYGSDFLMHYLSENFINGGASMVRASVFKELGNFSAHYPLIHDYEMWLRMLLNGYRIQYIPQPLNITRVHSVNIVRWHACQEEFKLLLRDFWSRYHLSELFPDRHLTEAERLRMHTFFGQSFASKRMSDLAISEYRLALKHGGSNELWRQIWKQRLVQVLYPLYSGLKKRLKAV